MRYILIGHDLYWRYKAVFKELIYTPQLQHFPRRCWSHGVNFITTYINWEQSPCAFGGGPPAWHTCSAKSLSLRLPVLQIKSESRKLAELASLWTQFFHKATHPRACRQFAIVAVSKLTKADRWLNFPRHWGCPSLRHFAVIEFITLWAAVLFFSSGVYFCSTLSAPHTLESLSLSHPLFRRWDFKIKG